MKKAKINILVILTAILLVACSKNAGNESDLDKDVKVDKNELIIAMQEEPTTLDPIEQSTVYAENVIKQIFETLIIRTPQGELKNVLAKNIERPDELTYIIELNEGVKFSNGDDLTSEDVAYTLQRAAKSSNYAYIFDKIDETSYDISDPRKIIFKLKEPDASFDQALAHPAVSIVSKKQVEQNPEHFAENPVGTGPFKLAKWDKLNSIELAINENYWAEKPRFENMLFRIIPESNSRTIELESGQVDIALEIAPHDIQKIENNENLSIYRVLDNSVHYAGINTKKPPFDNVKAREALTYAIDVDAIVKSVFMGVGKSATSPINPNFSYSISDKLSRNEYDVKKANELLDEAGVTDGTKFTIFTNQSQTRKDIATIIQAQLKEVGIDVEIVSLEWGAFVKALENDEHNMFLMSWTPSIVDPHYTLYTPYHSKNEGVPPNFTHYASEELDNLIDEGIKAVNEADRQKIYEEIQQKMANEVPSIFLLYGEQVIGTRNNIQNFEPDPSGSTIFYKVSFK